MLLVLIMTEFMHVFATLAILMMVSHALTMMNVTQETTTVILMLYVSTLQVHIHVIVQLDLGHSTVESHAMI